MHGTTMVFLAIMPLSAAFFNLLVPLQIGARDVAFPRLNMFSYWLYLFGGLITVSGFFAPGGAASFGWFAYTPLSLPEFSPDLALDFWVLGLGVAEVGAIAAAVGTRPVPRRTSAGIW